ncbi:Squamous cell carcinoma antigen recognized by T-cells 3 like [Actinidia chinensis var. chinensis]|uniref:Squamous cell carcinoma antigen recognized by T-cells 3 like n=1 Tax=Actinidia chinensis var. chinensis TaxID=1590841 RepID=A0A2R6R178_ACTCC|nr:Squamous cell carcinoma antigen recognized by T-cells 3 like [Actinidia chinensis var. chinensis]
MEEALNLPEPQISDEVMNEAEHQSLPEVQNPKNPTDSDSDSDSNSGDSDDEAQETLQIQTLETELSQNPANYDSHVQFIRALRKHGDIEKLRRAREAMSELFPLSPSMWQDWAKDETSLSSGPESFPAIEKLYERGVFDYLSVSLWCDYLNFVQEHEPSVRECSPAGVLKARNLFERALTAAGLHVTEGYKIWEAYKEFELAIFYVIDETDVEAREKQVQRVRNIFHRQLSVPHSDLRSTLVAYKSWETEQGIVPDANSSNLDGISSHIASAYQKALEMLDARVLFEERISRQGVSDMERLQEYMAYLKFEESCGDPARVQILYERAVTEFPISNDLWLDYTRYLDRTLKASSIVKDVYSRATKNCPWVGELWVRYLLSLERGRASEKEMSSVFEKSILCTFSSYDEYLDIFLTRVDGLRRRISQAGEVEDVLDYALIRETFQRASDYLSPHLKDMDGLLRIHSYWAQLELSLGKDLVAARGVWESLLKISGSMLDAWQGYIAMEIQMGNINEARSLYRRCYSKRFSGTGSEDICHAWLRFEKEFGTLEDFDHAVQKVTPRLENLHLFRLQQESINNGVATNQRESSSKKISREKRKQGSNIADEQPTAKRRKDTAPNKMKGHGEDKVQEKNSLERNKIENFQIHDGKGSNAHGKYNDQCTAFISNLGFQATYNDIHRFFSDVGGIVAIRILKDKYTGKSRGLAYVDFSDDAHLAAAVAKNKKMLMGKRLSIARSDPKQRRMRESSGRHTPAERDHENTKEQTSALGESDSKDSSVVSEGASGSQPQSTNPWHEDGNVQLKGKNTFAVPRAIRPLGWVDKNKSKTEVAEQGDDEKAKSNDEFRKMFLKK